MGQSYHGLWLGAPEVTEKQMPNIFPFSHNLFQTLMTTNRSQTSLVNETIPDNECCHLEGVSFDIGTVRVTMDMQAKEPICGSQNIPTIESLCAPSYKLKEDRKNAGVHGVRL